MMRINTQSNYLDLHEIHQISDQRYSDRQDIALI